VNWDELQVDAVVVHYVPTRRDDPDATLLLTDSPIPLDPALHLYFRNKIVERLEGKGLEVVDDTEVESSVPDAVRNIAADPRQLVASSKILATRLDEIQTGINSSGLLAVATASVDTRKYVAIVKLERERGIRFAITREQGRNVVDMELLRDLTLTDKTKVYKTALLGPPNQGPEPLIEGFVADDQRSRTDGVEVATFFLSRFLGCKPKIPAARMTFEFVRAANKMINEDVESPERKGQYQVALLAKMQDNSSDVRPSSFANENLAASDREKFLQRVEEAGVERNTSFTKDTSLVKVSSFKMTFESGMVLVGSKDALEQKVTIPEHPGPDAPVELGDSVDAILTAR
jgi:hypothetical protein